VSAPRRDNNNPAWDTTAENRSEAVRVRGDTRAVVREFLPHGYRPEGELRERMRVAIVHQDLEAYRAVCHEVRRKAYAMMLRHEAEL
jgi:hypothetical protein